MSKIQFRVAARTDAAGKYNPNAPLEGNEDNMFVDSDLARGHRGEFNTDVVVDLSDKGCLMVVADGMGGMNAGEVASAIAIKTVKDFFAPEKLTESIYKDSKSRMRYMESVVVAADEAIKADSTSNPEHEGMGSTIIMGWLCGDEICLTWCGDSRAYLFRPGEGLRQVSKDHSYVQGLVDEGKITEAQAFDHPYGNIIVRSLGDPEKKAQPDSRCFKVYQGDIFMLCSDGLSGVLRDRKTYNVNGERLDTENLEDIIAAHRNSMAECRDCLFEAAQRNDWYDNVTAVLCEILRNDAAPHPVENADAGMAKPVASMASNTTKSSHSKRIILFVFIAVVAFGLGVYWASSFFKKEPPKEDDTVEVVETDTVSSDDSEGHGGVGDNGVGDNGVDDNGVDDGKTQKEKKGSVKPGASSIGQNNDSFPSHDDEENGSKWISDLIVKDGRSEEDTSKSVRMGIQKEDGIEKSANKKTRLAIPKIDPNDLSEGELFEKCKENWDCCVFYLEKHPYIYNKKNINRKTVMDYFDSLYQEKIKKCKTVQEVKAILDEHDDLMKRTYLTGTDYDTNNKKKAKDRQRELE